MGRQRGGHRNIVCGGDEGGGTSAAGCYLLGPGQGMSYIRIMKYE